VILNLFVDQENEDQKNGRSSLAHEAELSAELRSFVHSRIYSVGLTGCSSGGCTYNFDIASYGDQLVKFGRLEKDS
jgi:hypothetical protein